MTDEESEWDAEDDDELVEHHGHKHTKDEIEKIQRIQKNFRQFLIDNADDMLDPKLMEKIQGRVEKALSRQKLTPTLTNLKAFLQGYEFGVMTQMNLGDESARVFAGINKIVADREKKIKKVDISESKPMEDGKEKQ